MPCVALPCIAVPCHAMSTNGLARCVAVRRIAMHCDAMRCHAMNCRAMPCDEFMKRKFSRTTRKLPRFLEAQEYRSLIKQPNKRYKTGLRNLCLIRIMGECGLRRSEALALHAEHIDWKTGRMIVMGKGRKERYLLVPDSLLVLLEKLRVHELPTRIFHTLKGGPLSPRYVHEMVGRYARKAGIEKHVHPHMLRHTFATHLLRQTGNLLAVKEALGHADISTTGIYTHMAQGELETILRGFKI